MEASPVSVLVVDDYEPFRRFVCSTLGKRQDLQVIGEASYGLEAVRKAEELKPDLIVLDIGLPTLNGIEVARRILRVSPKCKILFLSQESSAEVAQEALRLGAMGYVVKADAGDELAAAVEAVCQGRSFISKRIKLENRMGSIGAQAPGQLPQENLFPPQAPEKAKITHSHEVQFYPDEEELLSGLSCFIEAAIKAGYPAIAVASESHRDGLLQRLLARGVDAAAAIEQGRYIPLDVDAALSTFMVNDLPNPVLFRKIFGDLLSSVTEVQTERPSRVAACGEFAPTLWAQGKREAAIQIEHLTDEIAKTRSVDILCGYVLSSFPPEQVSQMYERICAEHSAIHSR